jgi:ATP-grasp domain
MTGTEAGVLHLLSPTSVEAWFRYFVTLGTHDEVAFLGENTAISDSALAHVLALHTRSRSTHIHSSHHSLSRDVALGEYLSVHNPVVTYQTPFAASVGLDKLVMKRVLDDQGLPSVPWRCAGQDILSSAGGPFVIKRRHGTECRDVRLALRPTPELSDDEFEEPFISGVEYSVVVYRAPGRCVTLPVVWKGPTNIDLVPPFRRLRMCPAPSLTQGEDLYLRRLSAAVVESIDSVGFAEVELIVDSVGTTQVIEINPRVAGTLRISAVAANVNAFDIPSQVSLPSDLPALRCAAEFPASEPRRSEPDQLIFATSRVTVGGRGWSDVMATVERASAETDPLWRRHIEVALKTGGEARGCLIVH